MEVNIDSSPRRCIISTHWTRGWVGHTAGLDVMPSDLGCRICDTLGGKEWAGVAQSVKRLATGWKVRGLILVVA